MHVHVTCPDGEAKFWREPGIELAQNHGLDERRLRFIEALIRNHEQQSGLAGSTTSRAEVKAVTNDGFSLALEGEELFVSFADFPWFKGAPGPKLVHVELLHPGHLYWPELDIDLAVESIRSPERFPLISKRTG